MNVKDTLIKDFVNAINTKPEKKTTMYYGEIVEVTNDSGVKKAYVHLDGSEEGLKTPIVEGTEVLEGDRVLVIIENHQAVVLANITSPASARTAKNYMDLSEEDEGLVIGALNDENNNYNVLIKADGVYIRDGQDVMAIYGGDGTYIYADGEPAAEFTAEGIQFFTDLANYAKFDPVTGEFTSQSLEYLHLDNLEANFAHITNGVIDNATIDHADINDLEANYAHITEGVIDNAKIGYADVKDLEANYAHITNGVIDNATIDHADINDLEANYAHITEGVIDNAKIGYADVEDLEANYASITNGVITNATIDQAKVNNLQSNYAHITNGFIDNADIKEADVENLTTKYAHITNGYIDNADIKEANVENLTSKYAHITNGTIDNAKIGYADVDGLHAHYATVDIANVNNAWLQNGVVKNAAITNEQVQSVSANKLTAGTIDASEINVANLRAKNLIVEKMNGQPILGGYELVNKNSTGYSGKNPSNEGWYEYSNGTFVASTDTTVNMSKAYYKDGTQVALYDQAYIDGLENDLNQRIDGAVEVFSGSVVPTLVNYPAVDWSSTQMASHVGNVYYLINEASDENGYCYRFTYDNTTSSYKWVLIKDSDVTKALADISDLQTFQSDTTSWITETDDGLETIRQNHTNLSGVVNKTVKSSTQLWFTKADTNVPTAPTSEVTSDSTSGNAWRRVVPTYNASYPYYFYCWQYKFVDNTFGWSAVIYDQATSESEERARTGVANAATADGKAVSAQNTANANIKSSVQLWFTKANTTAPSKPTSQVTNNSATGSNSYNKWNLVVPVYNSSYPYYYYCYQQQKGDGTYQWSDVVYDQATSEAMKKAQEALPASTFTTFESTTFKNVKDTVDEQSSTITNLSSRVDTKADSSTVTTLSNTVSSVSQTATSNSSKLSQLTTTLGTNADGTTKTNDIMHRMSATEQDLSGFKTTVSQTYTTKTEFNNLEIGGTNLLLSSGNLIGWNKEGGVTVEWDSTVGMYVVDCTSKTQSNWGIYQDVVVEPNTEYTMSVTGQKATDVAIGFGMMFYTTSDNRGWPVTDNTFTATASRHTSTQTSGESQTICRMYLFVTCTSTSANNKGYFIHPKLEKGNRATDWSPSPNDYSTTTQMESAITQKANEISFNVSETYTTREDFENLRIGGQNLFGLGSDCSESLTGMTTNGFEIITEDGFKCAHASGAMGASKYIESKIPFVPKPKEPMTISAWVKIKNIVYGTGSPSPMCEFYVSGQAIDGAWRSYYHVKTYVDGSLFDEDIGTSQLFTRLLSDTNWHKVEFTFNWGDYNFTTNCLPAVFLRNATGDLYVRDIKYERGTRATDWSPAPEDLEKYADTAVTSFASRFSVTPESISSEVQATQNGATLVTRINQTADSVKIQAKHVEIDGTAIFTNNDFKTSFSNSQNAYTVLWDAGYGTSWSGGEARVCKKDPITGEVSSTTDGWVIWNGTKRTVPSLEYNPNSAVPFNIPVYFVLRLSSASSTTGTMYPVWYADSKWNYLSQGMGGSTTADWTWVEATDIVLASCVEPASEALFTDCVIYDPPWNCRQVTTYTVTASGANALASSAKGIADAAAPKTSAISRSQRIYWRAKTANGKPSINTTWLATSGTGYGNWSLSIPQLTSGTEKYPFLYTAVQTQTVSQQAAGTTCSCSEVLLDDTTTVIDGGTIITNSVTANKLDASNINASNLLTVGAMTTDTQSSILNSNVQFGGRNLWGYGSQCESLDGFVVSGSWEIVTEDGYKCAHVSGALNTTNYIHSTIPFTPRPNETMTISCMVKLKNIVLGTTEPMCELYVNGQNIGGTWRGSSVDAVCVDGESKTVISPKFSDYITDTKWHHFALTRTFGNYNYTNDLSAWVYLRDATGDLYVRNLKYERGNKASDWTPAPEDVDASAVAKTQRVYYRSNSSTKPTAYPTGWVTETGNKWNSNATTASGWTTKQTPIASGTGSSVTKYLYLWCATQRQMIDGTVKALTASDIALDDTSTVIDGGKIITGSVSANSINAASGTFDVANIPDLNASKITAGTISVSRIPDDALNSNVQIGGRNLLRGTRDMNIGNGHWDTGTWRYSNGTGERVTLGTSPIPGITTGIKLGGGESAGFAQDLYNNYGHVGEPMVYSGWFKGTAGQSVLMQAFWWNDPYQSASTSKILQTNDWERLVFYIPNGFLYDNPYISIGYIYNYTEYDLLVCGLKLEYGTNVTDWSPAPEDIQAEIDTKKSIHTLTSTSSGTTYATLLGWSEEGKTNSAWTINTTATPLTNVRIGDTCRIAYRATDMNNAVVYVVGEVTAISGATIYMTMHGLDTTVIDGGHILTGTIDANKVNISNLTVGAMTQTEQNKILNSNISIGGDNLLLARPVYAQWTSYNALQLCFTEKLVVGQEYTLQLWGVVHNNTPNTDNVLMVYWGGGQTTFGDIYVDSSGYGKLTFTPKQSQIDSYPNDTNRRLLYIYNGNGADSKTARNLKVARWKLERGNKATDWSPCHADVEGGDNILYGTADPVADNAYTVGHLKGGWRPSGGSVSRLEFTTSDVSPISGVKSYIRVTNTGSSNTNIGLAQDGVNHDLRAGDIYTLSAYVRAESSSALNKQLYLQPIYVNGTSHLMSDGRTICLQWGWQYMEMSGILVGNQETSYSAGYAYAIDMPAGACFGICGMKLERSPRGSAWSPAPVELASTATNYITQIDSNGIWVTPSGKKPSNTSTGAGATGAKIDGTNGFGIWNNGVNVAQYGSSARIGAETSGHVAISSAGMDVSDSTGLIASFERGTSSSGSFGKINLKHSAYDTKTFFSPGTLNIDFYGDDTVAQEYVFPGNGVYKAQLNYHGITYNNNMNPVGSFYEGSSTTNNNNVSCAASSWQRVDSLQLWKGIWLITFGGAFASHSSGMRYLVLNTSTSSSVSATRDDIRVAPANGGQTSVHATRIVNITSDTVTFYLWAYQNSGTSLSVSPSLRAIRMI